MWIYLSKTFGNDTAWCLKAWKVIYKLGPVFDIMHCTASTFRLGDAPTKARSWGWHWLYWKLGWGSYLISQGNLREVKSAQPESRHFPWSEGRWKTLSWSPRLRERKFRSRLTRLKEKHFCYRLKIWKLMKNERNSCSRLVTNTRQIERNCSCLNSWNLKKQILVLVSKLESGFSSDTDLAGM